jgi:hypothetical protein
LLDRVANSSAANRGADNASASRGHSSSRRRSRRHCRGTDLGGKIPLGHAPWPSIGRSRNSCNLKRPVYSWRTTHRHPHKCWSTTSRRTRLRRERPRRNRAAEQRDEIAALHVEHRGLPPLCAIDWPVLSRPHLALCRRAARKSLGQSIRRA